MRGELWRVALGWLLVFLAVLALADTRQRWQPWLSGLEPWLRNTFVTAVPILLVWLVLRKRRR
ncbi:hypothetical protein C2I19_09940 [Chromobacterium alticapitis]|uniref:Uncharacterized protein n=1 Tax=Chromobacterium alticapitis TaxID=2073169 RepID=A0A2S5DGG1_9NEIS|nr:hypothetical protein C2I19_09940 [Chromobacterium alticapitis]